MPRGLPSSTKYLYVFQNNINTLQQQDFIELGKLGMLDLSQNALIEIPDGVFSPLSSLHNLDLSSNHITHISKDSFSGLVNLERLYLYSNQIQSIHPAAFEGLQNLLELKLQGNQISVLPALQLPRLLHLDLSYNSIPPIGPEDLQTPHLESLKIAGLRLTSLDEELLSSLVNLHVLDVSQNLLVEIQPTLKAMGGLRNLNLTGNPLGSLKQEDFQNLVNLLELDLSNLNLQGFPEGFFNLFPKLEKLTAAENPFNCLCPLAWFPVWLKDARVELLRMEETRCHFPPINSGEVLAKLEHKDFGCPTTTIELTSAGKSSTTSKPTNSTTPSSTTQAISPAQPNLHHYIHTRTHIRGIRLTYRNLSGPDRRPMHLNVPPTYPEYTLRGLQPNTTYSVCASPLGEPVHVSVSACMEARTSGISPYSQEPSVDRTEPSSSLIPIMTAVAVVMVVAIIATVVVIHRRRRSKAPADIDLHETSPLELEGMKTSPENGLTHPKQPDITPCPSIVQNSLEYEPAELSICLSYENLNAALNVRDGRAINKGKGENRKENGRVGSMYVSYIVLETISEELQTSAFDCSLYEMRIDYA
ncbi:hypothetical protein cypCar_00026002 [Cyprinus carpio]|nr:hypothetical protein cypCar_00026002 [Cyprinus carpio]